MTTVAQAPLGSGEAYRVLRELGKRARRTFAVIREPHELLVLQRFVKRGFGKRSSDPSISSQRTTLPVEMASEVTEEEIALLLRDARCLEKNWHPNVTRVKHVTLAAGGDLRVATELIDGVTLADLASAASSRKPEDRERLLPLPVLLRILVDVLGGLHGLHGLRDGMKAPLSAIHGELSPVNVVVGRDGVARLLSVLRPRPVRLAEGSEATGYAAPETTDPAALPDARADVYAVGVMLWEAITGERLFPDGDLTAIAQRQRSEDLAALDISMSSPFARLVDVAVHALAFDPALRYRSASEMAAEIRRIAGTRLAPGSVVAQTVAELAGERIRARRAELDPVASGTRRRASSRAVPLPSVPDVDDRTEASASPPSDALTSEVGETPADASDDDEVTQVHPNAPRPLDPPKRSPEDNARYVVVPPRPVRESVDEEALGIASATEPEELEASDVLESAEDDEETAVGNLPGVAERPTPPTSVGTPRGGLKVTAPAAPTSASTAARVAPKPPPPTAKKAPVADIDRSDIPRLWAESSLDHEERSPSIVPAPPPGAISTSRSVASAAPSSSASTVPRLWSDSSAEIVTTNVLEGDFVRALRASAPPSASRAAPPAASARPPAPVVDSADAAVPAAVPPPPAALFDLPKMGRAVSGETERDQPPQPEAASAATVAGAGGDAPFVPATRAERVASVDAFDVGDAGAAKVLPSLAPPVLLEGGLPGADLVEAEERRHRARRGVVMIVAACVALLLVAFVVTRLGGSSSATPTASGESTTTAAATPTPTPTPPASATAEERAAEPPPDPASDRPLPAAPAAETETEEKPPTTSQASTSSPRPAAPTARPTPAPVAPAGGRPAARPKRPSYEPLGI